MTKELTTFLRKFDENWLLPDLARFCFIIGFVYPDGCVTISAILWWNDGLCYTLNENHYNDMSALRCVKTWDKRCKTGLAFASVDDMMKEVPEELGVILYRGEGKWETERERVGLRGEKP